MYRNVPDKHLPRNIFLISIQTMCGYRCNFINRPKYENKSDKEKVITQFIKKDVSINTFNFVFAKFGT